MRSLPSGFIEPCIPTVTTKVPHGPLWIHEVKQDGYRMIAKRGEAMRIQGVRAMPPAIDETPQRAPAA